jgi:DNA-binding MarR family transcriptional regulator
MPAMEAITRHEHVGRELPPAISERLGFLFGAIHQTILRRVRETGLLEEPLTGKHFGCLTVILSEGPLSQQALGQRMGVDRSTIVALVDDLEAAGFVERRRNPADRRAYALEATAAGRRWQEQAERAVEEVEDELLAPLSAAERRQLIGLLQRVLRRDN